MATAPTAARVISKDGNVSTGWVINGQTFKDQQGNQRIDSGSTVELNDGRSWVYNDKTGGVPTAQTARNEYKNNLNYGNYDSALNTMQSGINSRVSAQQAAYNRQADKIRRDAELAKKEAKEAYIQASNPYGPIGQRLEALGLGDSGYAETTYTRLGNQYQKLLSDQTRATEDALAGIYGDIEAAYAQADYDRAMAAANIMLQKDSAMRSDNQFLANWDMNNYQNAVENNRYDQQRQDQLNRYAIEDARYNAETAYQQRNDALALILSGYIDEPTAKAAGMTYAEAMARYRQYLANQPVTSTRSGGGSSGGKKSGSDEPITEGLLDRYDEYMKLLNSGQLGDKDEGDVMQALTTEFKFANVFDTMAAVEKLQKAGTQAASANSTENAVYGSEYNSVWKRVRDLYDKGKSKEEIFAYLERISPNVLTEDGIRAILSKLYPETRGDK